MKGSVVLTCLDVDTCEIHTARKYTCMPSRLADVLMRGFMVLIFC